MMKSSKRCSQISKKYLKFASEHSAAEGSNWNRQMEHIAKNLTYTFEQVLKPGAKVNPQTNTKDRQVMEARAKAILSLVEDYQKRKAN